MKSIFLQKLIKELNKCKRSKDVPVSAIIVDKDKKIMAVGSNNRERKKCILGHAEIKVINKMFRKTKSKNLSEYEIYVTLKPCLLCLVAIEQANIKKVHYFLENLKCDYNKYENEIIFIKEEDTSEVLELKLKHFFKELRNKS